MANDIKVLRINVGLLATSCYMVWLDGRDDCVLIDPGAQAVRIRQLLQNKRVAAILLTHGHFDHTGAVDELMEEGVDLVVHQADAAMLTDPDLNASGLFGCPTACQAPTRTVHEGDVLHYAGLDLTVLHTPGHTAGCVCYRVGNHLFTGDTVMAGGVGRTDLPTGSEGQLRMSLRRLSPLLDEMMTYGGHD